MPTRKIADPLPAVPCRNPDHNPPWDVVWTWEPGTWEHTCPGCGRTVTFVVPPRPECGTSGGKSIPHWLL